ncbi:hypothetical protein Dsin_020944 [Dipteronia sinensis]|uniref:MADS-box domain-containing protein n=1 Tax=Dipteronia sinensis TaxID=43782 RepID=A0AAE0ABD9_9ROSI|nr:hypothetical protein Dsin_020944 [Dipteronia sinensis]
MTNIPLMGIVEEKMMEIREMREEVWDSSARGWDAGATSWDDRDRDWDAGTTSWNAIAAGWDTHAGNFDQNRGRQHRGTSQIDEDSLNMTLSSMSMNTENSYLDDSQTMSGSHVPYYGSYSDCSIFDYLSPQMSYAIPMHADQQYPPSWRRQGLFKKANEYAVKTSSQIAILVFSPANKPILHGSPTAIEKFMHEDGYQDGVNIGDMMNGGGEGGGRGRDKAGGRSDVEHMFLGFEERMRSYESAEELIEVECVGEDERQGDGEADRCSGGSELLYAGR